MNITPPMVGVPALEACHLGPISRMDCPAGTGVRPAARVIITVWLTSGRVYSARKDAAAPQKALTPGHTS